jgi:Putative general bacterial porin
MKLKILSAAVVLGFSSMVALADYRAEVSLNLGQASASDSDDDATLINLKGELFFNNVDTDGKPLAEAAFLQKASSVYLNHARIDSDFVDGSETTVGIGYYIPNTIFFAGAEFISPDEGDNDWALVGGVTPIDGWLLTTTYRDSVDYELNLKSKYVRQLGGETAINFEAGFADGGDFDDTITLGLDYYLDHNLSIGAYTISQEEDTIGIRGRFFFMENASAQVSYATADSVDIISVGASLRF